MLTGYRSLHNHSPTSYHRWQLCRKEPARRAVDRIAGSAVLNDLAIDPAMGAWALGPRGIGDDQTLTSKASYVDEGRFLRFVQVAIGVVDPQCPASGATGAEARCRPQCRKIFSITAPWGRLMKAMTSTARHNEDRRRRPDLSVQTPASPRPPHPPTRSATKRTVVMERVETRPIAVPLPDRGQVGTPTPVSGVRPAERLPGPASPAKGQHMPDRGRPARWRRACGPGRPVPTSRRPESSEIRPWSMGPVGGE